MRLLGLLFLFVSAFVFVSVSKNVHEALPQLIADAAVRSAVERCVADAVLTLVGGIFAVVLAFWCLNEAQMRWLKKQAKKSDELTLDYVDRKDRELREAVSVELHKVVMRVERVHGEALQRDTSNLDILKIDQVCVGDLQKRVRVLEAKLTAQFASPPPPTT